MKINREAFLTCLESIQPGLAKTGEIEQSTSIIFRDGRAYTFNEDIACRIRTPLDDSFHGAVGSRLLVNYLRKLKDEDIDVAMTDGRMTINGKGGRESWFRRETEVVLPIETVERPKEWKQLHSDFSEAIRIVQDCADNPKKNESQFNLTCVHLHPEWVEASSKLQVCRWTLPTGIDESCLVKRNYIRYIVNMGMTKIAQTPSWVHFRSPTGLVFSCRTYPDIGNDKFPDLSKLITATGEPLSLPKGLIESVDIAKDFAAEDSDSDKVLLELRHGRIRVKGLGINGGCRERCPLKYEGRDMTFLISPQILIDLVKRHSECQVDEGLMIADGGGKYKYACSLVSPTKVREIEQADGAEQ